VTHVDKALFAGVIGTTPYPHGHSPARQAPALYFSNTFGLVFRRRVWIAA
jgi:hypothetical protein